MREEVGQEVVAACATWDNQKRWELLFAKTTMNESRLTLTSCTVAVLEPTHARRFARASSASGEVCCLQTLSLVVEAISFSRRERSRGSFTTRKIAQVTCTCTQTKKYDGFKVLLLPILDKAKQIMTPPKHVTAFLSRSTHQCARRWSRWTPWVHRRYVHG